MASIGPSKVDVCDLRKALQHLHSVLLFNNLSWKNIFQGPTRRSPRNSTVSSIGFNLTSNNVFFLFTVGVSDAKVLHESNMLNSVLQQVVDPRCCFKLTGVARAGKNKV